MPAISIAEKAKYGLADGSGKRTSTRLPLDLQRMVFGMMPICFGGVATTGASKPGINLL